MTKFDEIFTIANKLANQGKKPTVALVKTKLTQPLPLPQLIQAVKVWQHDPEFTELHQPITETASNKIGSETINENIHQQIELALEPLKNEILALKQEISELKTQLANR